MAAETVFTMDTSSIKYGPGVTREVGYDMKKLGTKRVMVVTDRNLSDSEPVSIALEALVSEGIDAVLFDQARVEPTDVSFQQAIQFATEGQFDGYVAVGGGSSMDTLWSSTSPLRAVPVGSSPPRMLMRARRKVSPAEPAGGVTVIVWIPGAR